MQTFPNYFARLVLFYNVLFYSFTTKCDIYISYYDYDQFSIRILCLSHTQTNTGGHIKMVTKFDYFRLKIKLFHMIFIYKDIARPPHQK